MNSDQNLVNDVTQGLTVSKLTQNSPGINGPEFLKYSGDKWLVTPCKLPTLLQKFSVLKKQVNNTATN